MSNPTLKILPALMVAITAAFVTQSVCGQMPTPTPIITLTEYSSSNLTAVYTSGSGAMTNLTVTFRGPDQWTVTLPSNLVTTGNQATWSEPSSENSLNAIISQSIMPVFPVNSDFATGPGMFANNTRSTVPIAATQGTAPVLVYGVFNDLSDVPDTGTTASLFGLSLTGLAFLRRKLC